MSLVDAMPAEAGRRIGGVLPSVSPDSDPAFSGLFVGNPRLKHAFKLR